MLFVDPLIDFAPGLGPALLRAPGSVLVGQLVLLSALASAAVAGGLILGTRRRARSRP